MIGRVGAYPELPGWDPFEDPTDAPPPEDLEPHPDFSDDPLRLEGWVSGEAVIEMIFLELCMMRAEPSCPRCGAWVFTYGRLQFCSHGCPENLFVREASG